MIKQIILYDNKPILTLFHDYFDEIKKEPICIKKNIGNNIIEFKEFYEEKNPKENVKCDNIYHGFLYREHIKNPYSNLCCRYSEFINYKKELFNENEITDLQLFEEISKFVKEWSGFKLDENPLSISNILFFKPYNFELDSHLDDNDSKSIILNRKGTSYSNLGYIIKFKINDLIIDLFKTRDDIRRVTSVYEWNNIDLEVYSNNELIYAEYEVYFIRSISINMGIINHSLNTELKTIQSKKIKIESVTNEKFEVNNKKEDEIISYSYKEELIRNNTKKDSSVIFLTKDKYELALDEFSNISSLAKGELFIFDPYFVDLNITYGKEKVEDIIKTLNTKLNIKKTIVYECKKWNKLLEISTEEELKVKFTNEYKIFISSINEFKTEVLKRKMGFNMRFIGIKEHFHDRFIFSVDKGIIEGFLLGTSFNSFGDNYSSLIKLSNYSSRSIYRILQEELLNPQNIIIDETI